jgi:hypothetical protein
MDQEAAMGHCGSAAILLKQKKEVGKLFVCQSVFLHTNSVGAEKVNVLYRVA